MSALSEGFRQTRRSATAIEALKACFGDAHRGRTDSQASEMFSLFRAHFDAANAFERDLMRWYIGQSIEDALAAYLIHHDAWPRQSEGPS